MVWLISKDIKIDNILFLKLNYFALLDSLSQHSVSSQHFLKHFIFCDMRT